MAGSIDHMNIGLEISTIYSDGQKRLYFCYSKESVNSISTGEMQNSKNTCFMQMISIP